MKICIDQKSVKVAQSLVPLLDFSSEIELNWPAFFQCLGIESLFENFPKLDESHKLFSLIEPILASESRNELLIHFYDQIFVECLTHVKALPELNPQFLIEQIQKARTSFPFSATLDLYEKALSENPYTILHDLTLYLAFDRVCVSLASLFDRGFSGLDVLKECLVDSFEHIAEQGKTVPGLFRLIEALYSYHLMEENLQRHTDTEWVALCQGSSILQPRESLSSVAYIDALVSQDSRKVFTMDSADRVKAGLALTQCVIEKLKKEKIDWQHLLSSVEIVCLKESEGQVEIESSVLGL